MNWIIITGDSGAVGIAIVSTLLEQTTHGIIGISRRLTQSQEALLNRYPERYHHIPFDLQQSDKIAALYRDHIKPIGPIFGLVNNAAFAYDDIITNANIEPLTTMLSVNVVSPMMLTKYAIRDMLLYNITGSIVHITSVCAHTGYKGLSMYAATKGALESFSRTVAREWGARGIRSNCVAPGFMETDMSQGLQEEQRQRIYQRTSLKRETSIESVASTVLFLMQTESCSVTGAVIPVDNGTI